MSGGSKEGLTAALEALGAGDPVDQVDQVELFEPDTPLPLPTAVRAPAAGRGRPAGAKNRRTEAMLAYLGSRYRSPLVGLAETWSRTPEELARDLKLYKWHEGKAVRDLDGNHVLDTGAAAAMQQAAQIAALPYWHQKLPQAVTIVPPARGLLVMGDLGGDDEEGDGLALPLPPQGNQRVIDVTPGQSHDAQSHDAANALTNNEDQQDAH